MNFDLIQLVTVAGYVGIAAIIFAESGIMLGFFLPGDSLLFTAGLLAAQGLFNIWWLIIITFVAAVLGDSVGYAFGAKLGPRVFKQENNRLFHKDNLVKAQAFYDKHGPITIVVSRFTPFIRTFAPILAGVGKMN
ncbi:MAG: DedA family protein, partial [bacterium]|nr:DedA family protein [bacterium]